MPGYYNPYNIYPASYQSPAYQQPVSYGGVPQPVSQSYSGGMKTMEWVEGEVGAKAFQMPPGWPANQPIPLWDSTDTNIFLKSWSPMGFPNPLQKLRYTIEQQNQSMLPGGNSGDGNTEKSTNHDMSQYVTKDDLNEMRQELRNMLAGHGSSGVASGNQNGSGNSMNRGGNK